jgi:hypothetical protein
LNDFYSVLETFSLNDQLDNVLTLFEPLKVTSLEESSLLAIVDAIFQKALKIFLNEEVADDKKGGKKDDKKAVKKGGKEEIVVELIGKNKFKRNPSKPGVKIRHFKRKEHFHIPTRVFEIENRAKGKRNLKLWQLNFLENRKLYLIFFQTRN